jgi:hypothetical protein
LTTCDPEFAISLSRSLQLPRVQKENFRCWDPNPCQLLSSPNAMPWSHKNVGRLAVRGSINKTRETRSWTASAHRLPFFIGLRHSLHTRPSPTTLRVLLLFLQSKRPGHFRLNFSADHTFCDKIFCPQIVWKIIGDGLKIK